jgi:hypothetical protein
LKTIRETKSGDVTLRLVQTANAFVGLAIKAGEIKAREDGADSDDVWRRIHDAASRLNPLFIGYSSARARFLHFFPDGFSGARYVEMERAYKLVAKNMLDELMLSSDADAFMRLSADFTEGDRKSALHALKQLLQPHDCAKWTVVTFLPFLWKPEEHVFLKPTMISTFAERVGHGFAKVYRADLDIDVYDALLDLAVEARTKLSDMAPRDMIDIQSFMWTVVEYKEEDAPAVV